MNYRDHLTHWNGVKLKDFTHYELRLLIQELWERLETYRMAAVERNQPKSENYSFWG